MSTRLIVETLGILILFDALFINLKGDPYLGMATVVLGLATFFAGRRVRN